MSEWLLGVLSLGAVLSALVFGIAGYVIVQKDDRLEGAVFALCAMKDNLEVRVAESERFLRQHPNGIPGIPAADIQRSIANQQSTIDTISPYLDCPEAK